uniref:Xrn1 helical domain-containing protein n=1 Tax=Lactuca sativa TaxID=4236 RepID=A0A9R1UMB5_LACSA|nr:hypothetical protein LSAT_V11C800454190 [Lactuca sativa]
MMVIRTHFQATVIRSSPIQERENTLNLSAHPLPHSYQSLMITDDSRILDFYVDDFDVDIDGKRFIWVSASFLLLMKSAFLLQQKMIKKELTILGGRLIGSTLVQINIDVTALGAIIALGLMYLKDSSIRRLDSGSDTQSSLEWHQRIHPSEVEKQTVA